MFRFNALLKSYTLNNNSSLSWRNQKLFILTHAFCMSVHLNLEASCLEANLEQLHKHVQMENGRKCLSSFPVSVCNYM